MSLRIQKKSRVLSSKHCYDALSTCTLAANLIGKGSTATVGEVPLEIFKEIFKYCDLPTRCKLRRFVKSFLFKPELVESDEKLCALVMGQKLLHSIGSGSEMVQGDGPYWKQLIPSSYPILDTL
jgi:hypothetical protein